MGLYDHWPYTNFHELNLTWLLRKMEELSNVVENFVALNTIKYADPIQWNITTQYEANTVVVDPQTGTAYLSTRPVPSGIGINNTDYWSVIFTLDVISANKNLTSRDDGTNVLATFSSVAGDWLLWNGTLYKVSRNIAVNEAYVVGYNIDVYTVEQYIRQYITEVVNLIGSLSDLDTTDQTNIVAAINEVLQTLNTIAGNLADLNTTDKNNLVAAINEVNTALHGAIDYLRGTKCILIGDSFGTVLNADNKTMFDIAEELSGRSCIKSAVSGSAFYNTNPALKFLTQLQAIADDGYVKDIYVFGGPNDVQAPTQADIFTAISDFKTYANAHFINAKIHIAYTGYHWNMSGYFTLEHDMVIPAYKQARDLGIDFIDDFSSVLHSDTLTFDKLHPTPAGVDLLGVQIARVIKGLPVESLIDIPITASDVTAESNSTVDSFYIDEVINKNVGIISNYMGGNIQITYGSAVNITTFTAIATCNKNAIYPTENSLNGVMMPVPVTIYHGDSTVSTGSLYLYKKFNQYGINPILGDFTNVVRLVISVGTSVMPLDKI